VRARARLCVSNCVGSRNLKIRRPASDLSCCPTEKKNIYTHVSKIDYNNELLPFSLVYFYHFSYFRLFLSIVISYFDISLVSLILRVVQNLC